MGVVVAVKGKDRVYFGFSAQGLANFTDGESVINFPVFGLDSFPNALMAQPAQNAQQCIMKTTGPIVGELELIHRIINFKWVVRCLVPRLRERLQEFGAIYREGGKRYFAPTLFAFENDLYSISPNGYAQVITDAIACPSYGSAGAAATGVLVSTEGRDPVERILMALDASREVAYNGGNEIFVVVDTKDLKYDFYTVNTEEKE